MEQMGSPEMFDSPFFSLDNMPTPAAFDPNQQGPAQSQLQVPRQAFMPFSPQQYSQGYAPPQSRQPGAYPASPSWQLHSRQHQHVMPQYGNHYTFGLRHHPFALAHAIHHPKAPTETKARLDKKHVEILELEFAKNQKPSSIVKRELAEQMGHEIARINNWFQNRRAKEKSNKRTAEYAAREGATKQHRESSEGSASGTQSPEHRDLDCWDDRAASDSIRQPILSSARIGEFDSEENDAASHQQRHVAESEGSPAASLPGLDEDSRSNSHFENEGLVVAGVSQDLPHIVDDQKQFEPASVNFSQEFDYQGLEDFSSLPKSALGDVDYMDHNEAGTAWFHPLPQAPSDYFGSVVAPLSMLNAGAPTAMAEQFQSGDSLKVEQLASPVSMSRTPPPPAKDTSTRFALSSPRPVNIAARRNHQRPAPLGLAVSRRPSYCQGPKTGIDIPLRRGDDATPMRRTASATGLRRLQRVSEAGLRSPSLNPQTMRSPSYVSSASPVSPSRADTPGTNNSEDRPALPYGNFAAPLAARFGDSSISTPPVTPGLPLGYQGFGNPFEQAWSHTANDRPLATPSLCSHGGSEMDFPGTSHIPSYIASQPATPGFPRPDAFGPGFRFVHGGLSNAPEYTFPDSSYTESSLASSPHEQAMSKSFQFAQNVTPQDFGHED